MTVVWVLCHAGIHGNKIANQLAAEGTRKVSVDTDIGHELEETCSAVDDYCRQKWQGLWSLQTYAVPILTH